MKLGKYIKDKIFVIMLYILMIILIGLLIKIFNSKFELILLVIFLLVFFGIIIFIIDFFKKKEFYDQLTNNLKYLDKKYYVSELLSNPSFYEGKIVYDSLYEINKSMIERINNYKNNIDSFKEYIEMWIHEVKIPLASLILINHNNNDRKKYDVQISKLDNYIDQILYYVRSENVEKDFIIKENNLDDIISNVALKNKDDLLNENITLEVSNVNYTVLTDSKWLEFILNQLINNSIKYKKENDSIIRISASKSNKKTFLNIYDNGIGICAGDLKRVFDKSFTGENGRIKSKSTGMGLYIIKKLCLKLNHSVKIESVQNEYTKVTITFKDDDYYKIDENKH